MKHPLLAIQTHAIDFWLARGAVLVIVGLQLWLGGPVAVGPVWLAPAIELALLVPLSLITVRAQALVARATHETHWQQLARNQHVARWLAQAMTAAITVMNSLSLLKVVHQLLDGHGATGVPLLLDAIKIWTINFIAFALWYWSLDRGGPASHGITAHNRPDFLFPQMSIGRSDMAAVDPGDERWTPGFIDYLFLAFTNASAFSPTDTLPLTARAKLLMMAQSGISLLTVAFVAARAVNILA